MATGVLTFLPGSVLKTFAGTLRRLSCRCLCSSLFPAVSWAQFWPFLLSAVSVCLPTQGCDYDHIPHEVRIPRYREVTRGHARSREVRTHRTDSRYPTPCRSPRVCGPALQATRTGCAVSGASGRPEPCAGVSHVSQLSRDWRSDTSNPPKKYNYTCPIGIQSYRTSGSVRLDPQNLHKSVEHITF